MTSVASPGERRRRGLRLADDLLRGVGEFSTTRFDAARPWTLVVITAVCAGLYGAVMGSFELDWGERWWQVLFAAVKTPLLLLATMVLCLPAFWVLNTVAGLSEDMGAALRAILAGQACVSVALASLAPLTLLWYLSIDSYRAALLFNATMFATASLAGQIGIRRYYGVLIQRRPRHRWMVVGWFGLYAFVGIQMGWVLRPFIGNPGQPVGFFRAEPFSNAYVVVFNLVFG